MTPRVTAAWSAAALTVVLAANHPVYRVLMLLLAFNVLLVHRRLGASLRGLLGAAAVSAALATVLNFLLAHAGVTVLLRLPDGIPALGGPYTLESLVYGLGAGLGIAAALAAVAPISVLHEPEAVAAALPRGLERTGTAVAAALAMTGSLARSFRAVRDAQVMRGWRPRGPRSAAALMVPVALTAVEDAVGLAEAMAARGFGAGRRTRLEPERAGAAGLAIAVAALAGAALFLAARTMGWIDDWYPYPGLTVPAVSPAGLVAVVLLAGPVVGWKPRG